MSSPCEAAGLAKGLRALETLAAVAPIDPAGFGRSIGVELVEAADLLEAFEAQGYARRVPGGAFFVLTRLALGLVEAPSLSGRLVSQAIEPIVELGDRIGLVVALSIPSGRELICCAVSRCSTAAGVSPGLHRPWPSADDAPRGGEISRLLHFDDRPVALLAIHCVASPIRTHERALQRELEALAARLVGELRSGPAWVPGRECREPGSAIAVSAMLH